MSFQADLDTVVARTGHQRYRELCDRGHPDFDPGYIELVFRLAAELPAQTMAQAIAAWWSESESLWRGDPPRRCCGQSTNEDAR